MIGADHGYKVFSTVARTEQALDKCQFTGLLFSQEPDTIQESRTLDLQSARLTQCHV